MAKVARTRNTKEAICLAGGCVDYDAVLGTARCTACGLRVTRLPNGELMRHVAPLEYTERLTTVSRVPGNHWAIKGAQPG